VSASGTQELGTMTAKLSYQDGLKPAERFIEIPPTPHPSFNSCYVFAFPKSGSVPLNDITNALMTESGIPVVDMPAFCHMNGIALGNVIFDIDQIFRPKGYCYSGFRGVPPNMRGVLNQLSGNKVLMVRDPRDMLVSFYYSIKYSHVFPEIGTAQFFYLLNEARGSAAESIDRFCISNSYIYSSVFRDYLELLDNSAVKVLRYEDVVFDKLSLARTIRDWFSLDINSTRLNELVEPFNVFPVEERPHEHIRQIHPGDHRRKLQPATIEILDAALEKFIRRFDYSF
jgi:hypothetical protein